MTGLGASFRAECRDLVRNPLTWLGAVAVATAAWALGANSTLTDNGYVVFESALQPAARVAGFFLVGMAAVSVAGQRTRGVVRFILPRPISRAGFVIGNAGALFLLAVLYLVVAVGTSWLVAKEYGFGDVVVQAEDGFNIIEEEDVPAVFQAEQMRSRTATSALLVLPALLSATGIGLLVSCLLATAAGAVMVSIAITLPLQYLPEVAGLSESSARVLPFRAATDFLDQLREHGRHLATAAWPEYGSGPLVGALVASLALPCLAALLFSRLDITD